MSNDFTLLEELDKIADNRPDPLPEELTGGAPIESIGDSTTAALLEQKPLQNVIDVGTYSAQTNSSFANIMIGHVYNSIILPNCNYQYPVLYKYWDTIRYALRYGISYSRILVRPGLKFNSDLGVDFENLDVRQVYPEAGYRFFNEANVVYVAQKYSKSQIKERIRAKRHGDNLAALQKMLDYQGGLESDSQYNYDLLESPLEGCLLYTSPSPRDS